MKVISKLLSIVGLKNVAGSQINPATEDTLSTIDTDTGNIASNTSTIAGDTTSLDTKVIQCDTDSVTIVSQNLPLNASTASNQEAMMGYVDGVEDLLDNIQTAVEIIDNFISGARGLVTEDNSASIKTAVELIDNFISGSRGLVTEDNSAAIKTAVEIIDNFISGSRGLVTEDNSANILTAVQAIQTAVEIIDNIVSGTEAQCDIITMPDIDINDISKGTQTHDVKVTLDGESLPAGNNIIGFVNRAGSPLGSTYTISTTDGIIVAAPGAGYKIRVYYIKGVNFDSDDVKFYIRNGSGGTPFDPFYLAPYGGTHCEQFYPFWDLSENTALYYDYITGTTPSGSIFMLYEVIAI